jgi:hypothetical protein
MVMFVFFPSFSSNFTQGSLESSSTVMLPDQFSPHIGFYICNSLNPRCPMGLTDYGVNGNKTYGYTSSEFVSWANFTTLGTGKNENGIMTVQQDLVDYGVAQSRIGVYWSENVPRIQQIASDKYEIKFIDNIWNLSTFEALLNGVHGNLLGQCSQTGGAPYFYFCVSELRMAVSLPFEIQIRTVTGTLTKGNFSGDSYLEFAAYVYHHGALVKGLTYDLVAFDSKISGNPRFTVKEGSNPGGILNDAETVLCGPGGGRSMNITAISAKLSESYLSSRGLVPVPHAWSAGSDTAETVSGVHVRGAAFVAVASSGTDNNIQLW